MAVEADDPPQHSDRLSGSRPDSPPTQFLDYDTSWGRFRWGNDRVQDMLPPNTAPWQVDCFKLNDFEKRQVQERPLLEQVVGPPRERRESLVSRGRGAEREPDRHALLSPPSPHPHPSHLCVLSRFHDSLFSSN